MKQTHALKSLFLRSVTVLALICAAPSSANEPLESVTTANLSDRWPLWKSNYLEKGAGIQLVQIGVLGFHDVFVRFLSGKHTMDVEFCTALFQAPNFDINDADEWSTDSGWLAFPTGNHKVGLSDGQWIKMRGVLKQAGVKPALSTTTRATRAGAVVARSHSCIFELKAADSDVLLQLLMIFYSDMPKTEKIELSVSANAGASKP